MARDLMAAVAERVLVSAGDIGGLLTPGGPPARLAAEMNLTAPETVLQVHRNHLAAGAELLLTNSGDAHPQNLQRLGLLEQGSIIWCEAVRLCREAAGPTALVAATVGPAPDDSLSDMPGSSASPAALSLRPQLEAMLGTAVDLVLLRGYLSPAEAEAAVRAVREVDASVPIVLLMRADAGSQAGVAGRLAQLPVQVMGVSGGGLEQSTAALQQMSALSGVPLMAELGPVGLTPAQAGQQAARLIAYGARIVGCCCATPDHILQIARAAAAGA